MSTEDRIVELYVRGFTGPEIVEAVGWSAYMVYATLDRRGVKRRPKGPRPDIAKRVQRERSALEHAERRKAFEERAQIMDDMRANGATLLEIATRFGITKQRVHEILGTGS